MNCLHSFWIKKKIKSGEKMCKNKDFCRIVLPTEKNKIWKFNQYMKSDKIPYIVYTDLNSFIKKIDRYENNPKNSSTTK